MIFFFLWVRMSIALDRRRPGNQIAEIVLALLPHRSPTEKDQHLSARRLDRLRRLLNRH